MGDVPGVVGDVILPFMPPPPWTPPPVDTPSPNYASQGVTVEQGDLDVFNITDFGLTTINW